MWILHLIDDAELERQVWEVIDLLTDTMSLQSVEAWMDRKTPMLYGYSPNQALDNGRFQEVMRLARAEVDGLGEWNGRFDA